MISEPYKIKEVKHSSRMEPYERWNLLKRADFNTFNLTSDHVTFDLVARGMSAWSHHQKAGFMIGDEAYAGSANYLHLEQAAAEVLGLEHLVPTHNGIGAEKLVVTTMLEAGQMVLHNRGRSSALVTTCGGEAVDVSGAAAARLTPPDQFGADLDLERVEQILADKGAAGVAYVQVTTCPGAWNGQPVSLANLRGLRELAEPRGVPIVLDASNLMENALWIAREQGSEILTAARQMIGLADIVMMDAAEDCRADAGGFVTSPRKELFEKLRNQVVVFEGLHTYGGMTGRAMEVFAVGLRELLRTEYVEWSDAQVQLLHDLLRAEGVPALRGTRGIGLEVDKFLPQLGPEDHPKFVLAASLYIYGGIRPRLDSDWSYHVSEQGRRFLPLELPRCALTRNHIEDIARTVTTAWSNRDGIYGLRLLGEPEFVDQARFEPENNRLFVDFPRQRADRATTYEPYKIAIFEPINVLGKEERRAAMREAGYNTFLLKSADVYIDLLTDSGTSAMSSYQWEGMTNSNDTPFSSRHYHDLVEEYRNILGYEHIILTHQGRAAEHIMSQVMIKPGQSVPGNMYFTTTKLHQEMAGGVFVDVIVDDAHDPGSDFPWKGNIDVAKLQTEIDRVGPDGVAYVSFEMSVNMAGGQPFSMQNVRDVSRLCQRHGIPVMFDATRCVENAYMIKWKDPDYAHRSVEEILQEMMSYGDGCTVSCKKDFLVNMGGLLACNSDALAERFRRMLRVWEGDVTNGGLDPKDIEALHRGLLDALDDDYIHMRIEQTQELGRALNDAGIPIVNPPGSHAIFLDAKRFLPHVDQDEYPAQALASAIYIETGVRTMERGNVSKGRNPETGENYRPALELVRCTIPRRVYTGSHIDYVVEGIKRLWDRREQISGLKFVYEPKVLRFFQGRFEPLRPWTF